MCVCACSCALSDEKPIIKLQLIIVRSRLVAAAQCSAFLRLALVCQRTAYRAHFTREYTQREHVWGRWWWEGSGAHLHIKCCRRRRSRPRRVCKGGAHSIWSSRVDCVYVCVAGVIKMRETVWSVGGALQP